MVDTKIQVWVGASDVDDIKLVDHDAYNAPGLIDIVIGDVTLSLTEGSLGGGEAMVALNQFIARLSAQRETLVSQRRTRRDARIDQAMADRETEAILREGEERT